ncbi:Os07g0281900, partial [Oryza sativa Japonica Group]
NHPNPLLLPHSPPPNHTALQPSPSPPLTSVSSPKLDGVVALPVAVAHCSPEPAAAAAGEAATTRSSAASAVSERESGSGVQWSRNGVRLRRHPPWPAASGSATASVMKTSTAGGRGAPSTSSSTAG